MPSSQREENRINHIALCLYGRFNNRFSENAGREGFVFIQENILSKYPVDLFVYSNDELSFPEIMTTYQGLVKNILLEKPFDWDSHIRKYAIDSSNFTPKEGFRTISNSLNFFHSRGKSIELALEHSKSRNFEYPWIISARFDLGQIDKHNGYQPFRVSEIGFNPALDARYLYSALWNQTNAGIADQWFYGNQTNMSFFTKMAKEASGYFEDNSDYLQTIESGVAYSNAENHFSNEIFHQFRVPKPQLVRINKAEAIDNHLIHKHFLNNKGLLTKSRFTGFIPEVARTMYTHTDYADCWPIYFGQIAKVGNFFPINYIFVNREDARIPDYFTQVIYDESLSYTDRLKSCLEKIEDRIIFFEHEDMILYDPPEVSQLINYAKLIKKTTKDNFNLNRFDVIKMVRGGKFFSRKVLKKHVHNLKSISRFSPWIFSIQPSFWSRESFIRLLNNHPGKGIWDFETAAQLTMRSPQFRSALVKEDTPRRGEAHYDSKIYPYIATAIVKGKWNTKEYRSELEELGTEYELDLNIRGFYE